MGQIRVVLADDHAVVRAGLRAVLSTARDIEVVAEASSGEEALELVEQVAPDVVLMDLSMSGMGGAAATKELLARAAQTRVLVLTMHDQPEYLLPLMEAGAAGYLSKSKADTELADAVRTVARGETYLDAESAQALASLLRTMRKSHDDVERLGTLTQRERSVLQLLAEGRSASEIAEALMISVSTVDRYRLRLGTKLDVSRPSEYADFALRTGLVDAPQSSADERS